MEKKLVMAVLVGGIGLLVIAGLTYLLKGLNTLVYVLMVVFLLCYALFLKYLVGSKEEVKLESAVKTDVFVKPSPLVAKPVVVPGPLIKPVVKNPAEVAKKEVDVVDIGLDEYIISSLRQGMDKDQIICKLAGVGWDRGSIKSAFRRVGDVKAVAITKKGLGEDEKLIRERIESSFSRLEEPKRKPEKVVTKPKGIKLLRLNEGGIRRPK